MKYNIITLSDLHWDTIDPIRFYIELTMIFSLIEKTKVDMIVIAGDYYNSKISLNSKTSIYSIRWMNELFSLCKKKNIKLILLKGTLSHDNDQLDIFNSLEVENKDIIKIIRNTEYYEILPGLKCLFCPDENMNNKEYFETYSDLLYSKIYDMMFFHGSFDVVMSNILLQESEIENIHNVIFPYKHFSKICRVMIGGHWHNGDTYDHLSYTRSFSRWCYGEEKSKGFMFTTYDTETKSYLNQRIENPFTDNYITYIIHTIIMKSMNDYINLAKEINTKLENINNYIRIKIIIDDNKIDNINFINEFKQKYINNSKKVKIIIKNDLKENKKQKELKKTEELKNRFSFVTDANKDIAQKISEFIKETKNEDISSDIIHKYIDKYII